MATNYQYTDSHAKSEGRKVGRKILVLRRLLRPSALRHNKRSTQKTTEGRLRRNRRTTFASLASVRHNGPCVAAKPPLFSLCLSHNTCYLQITIQISFHVSMAWRRRDKSYEKSVPTEILYRCRSVPKRSCTVPVPFPSVPDTAKLWYDKDKKPGKIVI